MGADPAATLAPTSDMDVTVVLDGSAPAGPGKLVHRGALLEVTSLPWSALADADVVARTFYLAPSFAPARQRARAACHRRRDRARRRWAVASRS